MMIFITGAERSGTTVFRELICSTGALNADEIFNGVLNHKYRFYKYLLKRISQDDSLIYPIFHKQCFYEYVQWLEESALPYNVVADVKYLNYCLLSASYSLIPSPPFFIEFLKITDKPIIHIIRKNKLRMIISKHISEKTGIWVVSSPSQRPDLKNIITIDPKTLIDEIRFLIEQQEKAEELLSTIKNKFVIYYEEMFDINGFFSDKAINIAKKVTGEMEINTTPINIMLNNMALNKVVSNYKDVRKFLLNTEYSWMLE